MKTLLEKLKLIQYSTIELKTEKNEFIRKLRQNIDESDLSWGSSMFEAFSSSKNDFKGKVDFGGFKLRKRQRFFQNNMGTSVIATGSFQQKQDTLFVDVEINGFNYFFLFFFVFATIIYIIIFSTFIFTANDFGNLIFLPFIVLHAGLMFFLPYYFIKKGVKNMKRDLEKEFVFILNK